MSNDMVGKVQIQYGKKLGKKDLSQAHMKEIEQNILFLIETDKVGDACRLETIVAQIDPKIQLELELIAHVIVTKALDEPQHCKACVSLAGALHLLLPAQPSAHRGKKAETFMHALLDVFQTEFEKLLIDLEGQTVREAVAIGPTSGSQSAPQRGHRIRAIVHFAGYLYGKGLLGNGVVSQMVQDLVGSGLPDSANELLWFIGAVACGPEPGHLGTVLEDADSDGGASSGSYSSERRPSWPAAQASSA